MTTSRPRTVGPDAGPEAPYPYRMEGQVISGFGRGSKELGIPTANLPVDEALTPWIAQIPSGVYFGYASLLLPPDHPDALSASTTSTSTSTSPPAISHSITTTTSEPTIRNSTYQVYPMVMSIGYNPFYKNTVRSAEVHILHSFAQDFYHSPMRLLITGFIRDERDYDSLDALVQDIRFDCAVARDSLARDAWAWQSVGGDEAARWLEGSERQ